MKLFQVRKGQFVYYQNELHRVYAVKPMYKQSVHLIRLRDLKQILCSAKDVERYQPKEMDSFIFNKNYYTLSKDRKADVGDYILITNPSPDYLDHYSLNEIEVVASVENKGVITTNSNGIRHHEYLLMVPGRDENSHPIELKDFGQSQETDDSNSSFIEDLYPEIGDVYKKIDGSSSIEAMVVAIMDDIAYLGGDLKVPMIELLELEKWEFLYNVMDNS